MKKLNEHAEFNDFVAICAAELKIKSEIVYKDYWATVALRALASSSNLSTNIVFKGGTSLSKGWKVIDRYSEDLDILVTNEGFNFGVSKRQAERLFKEVHKTIEVSTILKIPEKTPNYYQRRDYNCNLWFPLPDGAPEMPDAVKNNVFVEMGVRGTSNPHVTKDINSLLGSYINTLSEEIKAKLSEYKDDWVPFSMELLKPERTFLEKLLCLHQAVLENKLEKKSRHLYDVYCIYNNIPEIKEFLKSETLVELLQETNAVNEKYFKTAESVKKEDLMASPIFQLENSAFDRMKKEYTGESDFYYKGQPAFEDFKSILQEIQLDLASFQK